MKWIKASERLPDKKGVYFVKLDRQQSPNQNGNNQVAHFTIHKEWYLENHHHSHDFYYITPFEWLDESDDQEISSLNEILSQKMDLLVKANERIEELEKRVNGG